MRKYLLPALAAILAAFAVAHAIYIQRPVSNTPPPMPPPTTPFGDTVAGLGMVEASTAASGTGNISIGSQVAGAVTKIGVRIGQTVKNGDVLFELDPRQADADLKVREANVPVNQAQLDVSLANLSQAEDLFQRAGKLQLTDAIAPQEYVNAKQALLAAKAQTELARANLLQSRVQVDQAKVTRNLLTVRAPVDGTILQLNLRLGEYVSTFGGQSLILMGNIDPMHVRINIDEEDIPRLRSNVPARAKIRGDAKQTEVALSFVRLEPFVIPKTSLTGINTERVDTRVIQVIYAIDPNQPMVQEQKILVGQIVDVFIDTRPSSASKSP